MVGGVGLGWPSLATRSGRGGTTGRAAGCPANGLEDGFGAPGTAVPDKGVDGPEAGGRCGGVRGPAEGRLGARTPSMPAGNGCLGPERIWPGLGAVGKGLGAGGTGRPVIWCDGAGGGTGCGTADSCGLAGAAGAALACSETGAGETGCTGGASGAEGSGRVGGSAIPASGGRIGCGRGAGLSSGCFSSTDWGCSVVGGSALSVRTGSGAGAGAGSCSPARDSS